MPMRCARRVNVEHKSACSWMSICSPLARLLRENGSGSEPAHQLQSALRALISAALVGENAAGDILEAPRGGATPIDIGQQCRAIRQPRALLA
jgi:hypothetical protein